MKLILPAFAILLLVGCSAKQYAVGNFQQSPIYVDGNSIDWGMPLRFGSQNGALQFNITNDNENVYVCVASSNKTTQMRMLRAGISIYVDVKGKESKSVGITFPLVERQSNRGPMNRDPRSNLEKVNPVNDNNARQLGLMEANMFKSFGFLNNANGVFELSAMSPIKIGMNYDIYDNLVMEASIPIKNFYDKNLNAKNAPSISVGVVLNSVAMGNRPSGGGSGRGGEMGDMGGGGMRGGGGGGMRGGGGGGGMRGGGGGGGMRGGGNFSGMDRSGINEPVSNWYQFKLAVQ